MDKVAFFRIADADDSAMLLNGVRLEHPNIKDSDLLVTSDFDPVTKFLLRVEKSTVTGEGSALIYNPDSLTAKQVAAIGKFGKVGVSLIGVSEPFDAAKGAKPESVVHWMKTGTFSEAVEEPEEDPLSAFVDFDDFDDDESEPAQPTPEAPVGKSAPVPAPVDEMPVIAAPVMPGEEDVPVAPAAERSAPDTFLESEEEPAGPPSLASLVEDNDLSPLGDDNPAPKKTNSELWESFSTGDEIDAQPDPSPRAVAPSAADDWDDDATEPDDDELFDAVADVAPPQEQSPAPAPLPAPVAEDVPVPEPEPTPARPPVATPAQSQSHSQLDEVECWAQSMVAGQKEGFEQAQREGLVNDSEQVRAPLPPAAAPPPMPDDDIHENGQRASEMLPSRIPDGFEDREAAPVSLYDDDSEFGSAPRPHEDFAARPYVNQAKVSAAGGERASSASRARAVANKAGMRTALPGTRPGITTLITGSHGGCGKTTVSYLMPYVMAHLMKVSESGKPVYLVEADYSNPKLAQRFSLNVDQDSGRFAQFIDKLGSGEIENMSREQVLAETKRVIEEITYVDEFTGLRVIACPYDTTSRSTDNLRDAIQKLVNTLTKEPCYVFIDGQTFSKDDVLDSTLASTADNVVLVGNGRHVEDAQSFRHMLTTPVESNGAGVSQDRVNIFLNQTSEARALQLGHEFQPTPVIGFLPQLPEIDDATDEATTAWVGKSLKGVSLQIAVTFIARAMREFMPKDVAPLLGSLADRSTEMKAIQKKSKKKRRLFSRG